MTNLNQMLLLIDGVTSAQVQTESLATPASLMLANLAIPYSQDDATVAMLHDRLNAPFVSLNPAVLELRRDDAARAWTKQFGKDIVAAGEARAKSAKR